MSRVIKLVISDKDYQRLLEKYGSIEKELLKFLECESKIKCDEEFVYQKVMKLETGTIFTYKDIFENKEDRTQINARLVRRVCKDRKLAVRYGYDEKTRSRLYQRL